LELKMSIADENLGSEVAESGRMPNRLRRVAASRYLKQQHGIDRAPQTLAKLAVTGGGPEYEVFGRIPYYSVDKLDEWVKARLSRRRSTSDRGGTPAGQMPGHPYPPPVCERPPSIPIATRREAKIANCQPIRLRVRAYTDGHRTLRIRTARQRQSE
jgi:hypothetical protein